MSKKIVTITGASGAGKDSLLDAIMYCFKQMPTDNLTGISRSIVNTSIPRYDGVKMRELVSHTTRQPRAGEVDGVDYYFISDEIFSLIDAIETTEYAGNHYCLSTNEVYKLEDGEVGLVIVDQHGVSCIEDFAALHTSVELFKIFIKLDKDTSESRMRNRGDKSERIEQRLVQQEEKGEYAPNEDKYNLILDGTDRFFNVVKTACEQLCEFIHH